MLPITTNTPDFEAQLEACRKSVSKSQCGKGELKTVTGLGRTYPLLTSMDEFVWFCSHTGWAAWHGVFDDITGFNIALDATKKLIFNTARLTCGNPECQSTIAAGGRDKKCPRCGTLEVHAVFALGEGPGPALPSGSAASPADFRGDALNALGAFWALMGAAGCGVVGALIGALAIRDPEQGLSALTGSEPAIWVGVFLAVALYIVLRVAGANGRGGVTVESDGLSFRSRQNKPRTKILYRDIQLLRLEYIVMRGFIVPQDQHFRITLYGTHGQPLFMYDNRRFDTRVTTSFRRALLDRVPGIKIFG